MKKKIASLLTVASLLLFAACTPSAPLEPGDKGSGEETEITLWTFPVGGWGTANSVAPILSAFRRAHPEYRVTLTCLDYNTGDSKIEEAISEGKAPDLVLEGPERLVANWGARGLMVPLNDIVEKDVSQEEGTDEEGGIYGSVAKACKDGSGNYYIAPICMTTHCMAINRDVFEAAGALQYIDEASHTWKANGFASAVTAIKAYYDANGIEKDVASVYCESQGGDQGTRALVNNLCGGTFTDAEHTSYTVNSPANIQALELLQSLTDSGLRFDAEMNGAEEQLAFCSGDLVMSFCWNVAGEVNRTVASPDRTFDILPMAFPAAEGNAPSLQGGIWGLGAFDNGDKARLDGAKEFIRFVTGEEYANAVKVSSYLPVRKVDPDPYENDALMTEYDALSRYLGDYYQITPGWAKARTAWWQLLQRVGNGEDVATAVASFPARFEE